MSDVNNAVKMIRSKCPGPYDELVNYIDTLEKTADEILVSAISEDVMRQNQGKVQILRELLATLRL